MANIKTKPAPAKKTTAAATEPKLAPTKKEMAEATPRPVHSGLTTATYRVGKKLTPLRKDYKAGTINNTDVSFIREVVQLGGNSGKFERRNLDAGRVGRLYTFGMVDFDETGVSDPEQIITVLPKARTYLKAAPAAA